MFIEMKLDVNVVYLLLIKICSSSTIKDQDINDIINRDPLTAQKCKSYEFDCGYKCIDIKFECDGKEDCDGGADEYSDHCVIDHRNASCPFPYVPQDRYDFQLNYSSKQNTRVPEFVRGVFRCKQGYFGNPVNEIISTCTQRSWHPPIMTCKKTCPEINNPELEQECYQGNKIDCNGVIWERTVVQFSCQKFNHEPTFKKAYCLPNGKWNLNPNQIKCRPICGYITRETVEALKRKDFPWRVMIREQINLNESTRHFSGTLLDKKIVLTDGNLFTRTKNPHHFEIIVNDDIESWGPPKSYKVKDIHFSPTHFRKFLSPDAWGSLAILETELEIQYSLTVLPACVNPYSFPASSEMFKNTGMMITLGDSEDLNRDEISIIKLKSLEVTCKTNREKCNQYYAQFNTSRLGNRQLTHVNLGTGLIKVDPELRLYYVEGVYSKQHPESHDTLIFTFVTDYIEWIDEIREITRYNNNVILNKTKLWVKQPESTVPETSHSLLTVFIILSFVILIAVLFQIK